MMGQVTAHALSVRGPGAKSGAEVVDDENTQLKYI